MLRKTFTIVQMKNYFHNMQRTLDQISNEYLSRNREVGRGHERELKSWMETVLVHAQLSAVSERVWESGTLMDYFWEHEVADCFFFVCLFFIFCCLFAEYFLGIDKKTIKTLWVFPTASLILNTLHAVV